MQAVKIRFQILLLVFASVLLAGTLGFSVIEKLSPLDSFYFTVITMSTVGYGDIHPMTGAGKLLSLSIIILGVGTFVSMLGTGIELMLSKREHRSRMEKLNMVIGAFLSELGNELLAIISDADPNLDRIRKALLVQNQWADRDFEEAKKTLFHCDLEIDLDKINIPHLRKILMSKRDFLVRLLENPTLLEHETFTSILWSVFHLAEELSARQYAKELPESDLEHLTGDLIRVYRPLLLQWLMYMKHLKEKYPYLLSLSIRTNPFDRNASVIVK